MFFLIKIFFSKTLNIKHDILDTQTYKYFKAEMEVVKKADFNITYTDNFDFYKYIKSCSLENDAHIKFKGDSDELEITLDDDCLKNIQKLTYVLIYVTLNHNLWFLKAFYFPTEYFEIDDLGIVKKLN